MEQQGMARLSLVAVALVMLAAFSALAQQSTSQSAPSPASEGPPSRLPSQKQRQEQDWSFLCDPARRTEYLDPDRSSRLKSTVNVGSKGRTRFAF